MTIAVVQLPTFASIVLIVHTIFLGGRRRRKVSDSGKLDYVIFLTLVGAKPIRDALHHVMYTPREI